MVTGFLSVHRLEERESISLFLHREKICIMIFFRNFSYISIFFLVFSGLFNISDKIMISLLILLEIREFFKTGHPLTNIINAKFNTLMMTIDEVSADLIIYLPV